MVENNTAIFNGFLCFLVEFQANSTFASKFQDKHAFYSVMFYPADSFIVVLRAIYVWENQTKFPSVTFPEIFISHSTSKGASLMKYIRIKEESKTKTFKEIQ